MTAPDHPLAAGLPRTVHFPYDHGPAFITTGDPEAVVIGTSAKGNHAMLIATHFNRGRIFLTSGHPEATSSAACRDLIRNALMWCSKMDG